MLAVHSSTLLGPLAEVLELKKEVDDMARSPTRWYSLMARLPGGCTM